MNLITLAQLVYNKSEEITIRKNDFNEATFTRDWINGKTNKLPNKKGWYWIQIPLTFDELRELKLENEKSQTKRINITKTIDKNLEIFSDELINQDYVYNGHAQKVATRLRYHFFLGTENTKTGALGLNIYPKLKNTTIIVRYFTEYQIDNITNAKEKEAISNLINNKIGRIAIENAWRTVNGFPILCKS